MKTNRHIQAIFYNNPDRYPPIINSIRLLSKAGFTYDLLCRDNGENWNVNYPETARVRRFGMLARGAWQEYLQFVRRCLGSADRQARVFIGHDMHGLLPARLLATRHHRPWVYHCHDYAESSRKLPAGSQVVRLFERAFARTADLIIVPDAERSKVIQRELRTHCAPVVVANSPPRSAAKPIPCLHETLFTQGRQFSQIVFRQGSLGPYHAIEPTIRSMPLWNDKTWGLVVMGASEPSYLDLLYELARTCGVMNQFVILPAVRYDKVANFTVDAQLGHGLYIPINLNHQYATTASNKIMEYMAASLPLLVSDRPALRALVEKYGCGVTADEASPESIATAVNSLLGDPERAHRMGLAARRAFEQEFCYEKQFAPAMEKLGALCDV